MGTKFFGVDMQKVIAQAMPSGSQGLPVVTLRKWTITSGPVVGSLTAGNSKTSADYVTRGAVTDWISFPKRDAPDTELKYKKVVLIGLPLDQAGVEPASEDEIVTPRDGVLRVVSCRRDAARAAYVCKCQG